MTADTSGIAVDKGDYTGAASLSSFVFTRCNWLDRGPFPLFKACWHVVVFFLNSSYVGARPFLVGMLEVLRKGVEFAVAV